MLALDLILHWSFAIAVIGEDIKEHFLTECHDFSDTTSYCEYKNSLCIQNGGLLIVNDKRAGETVPMGHVMSDDWFHLSRPDLPRYGLPFRDGIGAVFVSSSKVKAERAHLVLGRTAITTFDHMHGKMNVFHFAASVLVGFLARLQAREPKSSSEWDKLSESLASESYSDGSLTFNGFDKAILLTPREIMNDWAWNVARLAFSNRTELYFIEDVQKLLHSGGGMTCFSDAVLLGKSNNLFSGTWDAVRFRREVQAQHSVTFAKKYILIMLRRTTRKLLNEKEFIDFVNTNQRGYEVLVADIGALSFPEQLWVFSQTALVIAVHGAGLTNSIFMPTGAVVLEILPYKFPYILYQRIAINAGCQHVKYVASSEEMLYYDQENAPSMISSREPGWMSQSILADIRIDVNRFESYLKMAVDSLWDPPSNFPD
jgi:hypothetical protein